MQTLAFDEEVVVEAAEPEKVAAPAKSAPPESPGERCTPWAALLIDWNAVFPGLNHADAFDKFKC